MTRGAIHDSVYRMLWYTARYYWCTSASVGFTVVYWDVRVVRNTMVCPAGHPVQSAGADEPMATENVPVLCRLV